MKKRIKIVIMNPGLGRIPRGVETIRHNLALSLSEDFDVVLLTTQKVDKLCQTSWTIPQETKALKKAFKLFPFINSFLGPYFSYWPAEIESLTFSLSCFPKLLKKKYDIFFPTSIWGVMMARLVRAIKKTKFIYINHGGAENFIAKQKPDAFVVLTPDVLRWAKKNHPRLKSVLIPHGIELGGFSSRVKPVRLNLEKPVFLCVAALTAYKRIDLTIKAVALLKKASLVILGQGELKDELKKLGENLLGQKRFLLTSVPHEQIPRYYTAADVFTLASKEEIFGTVYLEALASGLPIVAPKDERREYIVGKAGILVEVNELDKYAQALEKAASKNWKNLPLKQAKKFSFKKQEMRYKSLIKQVSD